MEELEVKRLTRDDLMNPIFQALRYLGGEGTAAEIREYVIGVLAISGKELQVWHNDERRTQREIDYKLAWVRTYLKQCGVLENPRRGVWKISQEAEWRKDIDPIVVRVWFCEEKKEKRAMPSRSKRG